MAACSLGFAHCSGIACHRVSGLKGREVRVVASRGGALGKSSRHLELHLEWGGGRRCAISHNFTIILMKLEKTPDPLRVPHCHNTLSQTFSHLSLKIMLGKRWKTCARSFHRSGNESSGKLSNLSKVSPLVSGQRGLGPK